MGYITKFDGSTDKTIKLGGDGNPASIEGYFLGSKDTESDYGPGKLHIFQTKEGTVGVWGKTRMNSLLTEDHKGQMVLLSFTGMVAPSKKGRKPSYGYKLQYDKDNTIDTSSVNLNAAPPAVDEEDTDVSTQALTEGFQDTYEEPVEETVFSRPVAPRIPASVPSASSQAKVQALLNKGRVKTA